MHTFFSNHVHHRILINEAHAVRCPFTYAGHSIRTSDSSLSAACRVKESALEMRVQPRIELPIIAEHHTNRFIGIDDPEFEIRTKVVLQEIAMVSRHLEAVRASNFHQGLVACLPSYCMPQLLR